jgi:hypothetical protein
VTVQVKIAIGAAVVFVVVVAVLVAREAVAFWDSTQIGDYATMTRDCDGATVELTLTAFDSEVRGRVRISDGRDRTWGVRWSRIAAPDRVATRNGPGEARGDLGDLDEGTDASVRVRPVGSGSWCKLSADLSGR